LLYGEAKMNIQPNLRMSKVAFIEWSATEEERCELVGGRILMMPRPSLAHSVIVLNLAFLLRAQLDAKQWVVATEFGLDAGPETMRYPDVVVDRAEGSGKRYSAIAPVFLAEVLSPSNAEVDLGDKAAEYREIPSVIAYIVLSQDEPKAWVYTRSNGVMSGPQLMEGSGAKIAIATLHLSLPLSDIYAGIELNDPNAKGRP
jgi:Uma2 family endonuclease